MQGLRSVWPPRRRRGLRRSISAKGPRPLSISIAGRSRRSFRQSQTLGHPNLFAAPFRASCWGDEGRSITDFTHRLNYDDLDVDARKILRDLASTEREVCGKDGSWCLTRLRPYRTVEDKIDGIAWGQWLRLVGSNRFAEATGGTVRRLSTSADGTIVMPAIVGLNPAASYDGADYIGIKRTG